MLPPRIRRVFRLDARRPSEIESETDEEIRVHFDMSVEALVAKGMQRTDAELQARKRFGPLDEGRALMLQAARNRDGKLRMHERLDSLSADLRYAVAQLRRAPALTIAVVLTFALGIGANATMFGVIDRLLLRAPSHVLNPDQLFVVRGHRHYGSEILTGSSFSYPAYTDFRDNVKGFSSVAMQTPGYELAIGRGVDARKIRATLVSGNYFTTLGVQPVAGRFLTPDDAILPSGNPVAVISYGLWQSAFGGAANAVGQSLDFNSIRLTIVGVAPRNFNGIGVRPIDAWLPVTTNEKVGALSYLGATWSSERTAVWLSIVGRFDHNANAALVGAQATAALRSGERTVPRADTAAWADVESILPIRKETLSVEAKVAMLLAVVSALVLLIACANVANLLLARALKRRREIAIRLALGISRCRLAMQLLVESMLLALLGGAAALLVTWWGSALMRRVLLANYFWPDSPITPKLLLFTAIVALFVGLASGLLPALQGNVANLAGMLRDAAPGGVQRARVRTTLLLVQGVLSVVLLAGTGLFVESLRRVGRIDLGIDTDRIVRVNLDLTNAGFPPATIENIYAQLLDAAKRMPGVASAALGEGVAFSTSFGTRVIVPGLDSLPLPPGSGPNIVSVGGDYFATVGTKLVSGRGISTEDIARGENVAVVSAEMAKRVWPRTSAIGACVKLGADSTPCLTVIGVAANVHQSELLESTPMSIVYTSIGQSRKYLRARTVLIRARNNDAAQLIGPIRQMIQTTVPGLPYPSVAVMHSVLDSELRPWRLGATMFGAFGVVALLLTSIGLYSMVSYTVGQRMRELGIRMALGAHRGGILRLILSHGMRIAVTSCVVGSLIGLAAGRYVKPLLYEVSPHDPVVFACVAILLLVITVAASLVPALRATKTDPLAVLKAE